MLIYPLDFRFNTLSPSGTPLHCEGPYGTGDCRNKTIVMFPDYHLHTRAYPGAAFCYTHAFLFRYDGES